jgi:hypothetical protein
MNPIAMKAANTVHLTRLCPILHAWAAYFLESRTPYEALQIGTRLVTTLDTADQRDNCIGFTNWLQAVYVKRGYAAGGRCFSQLETGWAAVAPDGRVIRWASNRLRPYRKELAVIPRVVTPGMPGLSAVAMAAGAIQLQQQRLGSTRLSRCSASKLLAPSLQISTCQSCLRYLYGCWRRGG